MTILPLLVLASSMIQSVQPAQPPVPFGTKDPADTWEAVFIDEFDAPTLDTTRWRPEDAIVMNNQELQVYTPEAISFKDGALIIRADRRPFRGRDYTGALIDTRSIFSMAFGRFECRIKLPRGQGMWPAVWMLPEDDRWPPEIDIMENLGQQPNRIHTTHHWGPSWPNNQKTGAHFDGPDYSADFHVFSVEWTPDRIDWFIDGELKFTSRANIPQDPMYLIINLAVGGNWGGNPDATTVFPQELAIDWVRAFRRRSTGAPHLLTEARHGRIRPEPARWSFTPGETVKIVADADIGYVFKGWTGDASGTTPELRLEMNANRRIGARFEPAPNAPRLLSLNKPVKASGAEGYGAEPERAVDASLWTRWGTNPATEQWLAVDLGETRLVEAVRLAWAGGGFAAAYTIDVSPDGQKWTTIHTQTSGAGRIEKITGLDAEARHVRFNRTDTSKSSGCSLFSFEVYGH